ncbi:MAG: hypothetical protein V8S34_03420 [Lawsonibacter sp.]
MNHHEENTLILAVCSRGHTDDVMATAKAHGARGGTVIKARLSGPEELEQAYDLDALTAEREIRGHCGPHGTSAAPFWTRSTPPTASAARPSPYCVPCQSRTSCGWGNQSGRSDGTSLIRAPVRAIPTGQRRPRALFRLSSAPGSTSGSPPRCPTGR